MKLYKIWAIGLIFASSLMTGRLLGSSKINFINFADSSVLGTKSCNSSYISYGSLISHAYRIAAVISKVPVQIYRTTGSGGRINLEDERDLYVNCTAGDLNVYMQLLSPESAVPAAAPVPSAPVPAAALLTDALSLELSSGIDIIKLDNTIVFEFGVPCLEMLGMTVQQKLDFVRDKAPKAHKEPSDNTIYSIPLLLNAGNIGKQISIKKDSTVQSIIHTFVGSSDYRPYNVFEDRRRILVEAIYKDGRKNIRKRFWQLGDTLEDVANIKNINFSTSAVVYNSQKDFDAYQYVRDVTGVVRTGQAINNNNLFEVELLLSKLGESYADLLKDNFVSKKERVEYNYQ